MGKATQDLRKEHDAVLYVMQLMDKMMLQDSKENESMLLYYDEVLYFLKTFVDKCHHGKEENFLFKELQSKGIPNDGGPIGVMLQEHALGRSYIAQMSETLEAKSVDGFNAVAANYCDLLRNHIEKEDRILFTLADQTIDEVGQEQLFEEFEQFEENVIGHGLHEKLHARIDKWADVFDAD